MSQHSNTHRRITVTVTKCLLLLLPVLAVAACSLPQYAAAEASPGPEATPGAAGLPDGRVYEEVTPANKYGNEVRYTSPAFVAPDGQAVFYQGSGALAGESSNAANGTLFVSERTAHGWVARSTQPLPVAGTEEEEEYVRLGTNDRVVVPSTDLSHLLFSAGGEYPYVGSPDEPRLMNNLYLEGPDPFAEPEWVGRSLIEGSPEGIELGQSPFFTVLMVAGAAPDLKTIYFFYDGALFPGASRLYEYRDGVLSDAGALPNAETDSSKAVPAAMGRVVGETASPGLERSPAAYDNQVPADGSRIFFTREDEAGSLELYAHLTAPDGAQSTTLVSQSQLPGHIGEPAPDGPVGMLSTEMMGESPYDPEHGGKPNAQGGNGPSYVFASPDASHAFFQSVDRLTTDAPESTAPKTYDFDLNTGTLEYVPRVTGSIVTVADDGSSLIFENTATEPFRLERWTTGAGGGNVEPIAQLPQVSRNACAPIICVGPAFTSSNGKVIVFSTESPIAGFNDGGSHYRRAQPVVGEQIETGEGLFPNIEAFRYDAEGGELNCVSCPPKGTTPSSDAITSGLAFNGNARGTTGWWTVDTAGRPMSADGSRVFFETRDGLVPQDVNGTVDLYEWAAGKLSLISSGHSPRVSNLIGTSESGDDVFFATAEGIAPGDTDGSRDVYDARIPQPGDRPAPEAVPCQGAVCRARRVCRISLVRQQARHSTERATWSRLSRPVTRGQSR